MSKSYFYFFCVLLLSSFNVGCNDTDSEKSEVALEQENILFYGGPILTMKGMSPGYVQAVLVQNGRIKFTGGIDDAMRLKSNNTKIINLKNNMLLPSFIDAHSHVYNVGLQQVVANLYPSPDGTTNDLASLIQTLKEWEQKNEKFIHETSNWIIGNRYDDAQLKEKRHPTADDLDQVSTTRPVIVIHQSGHIVSVNHVALKLLGIDENTKDPDGGVIRRVQHTQIPNGILEEAAVIVPRNVAFSKISISKMRDIAKGGLKVYIQNGYTTVQEGRSDKNIAELWRDLADKGQLNIDVVVYPDMIIEREYMKKYGSSLTYHNRFRIGGGKISLDGSPQGKTAWLSQPYLIPPEGRDKDYKGYPSYNDNTVQDAINLAYQNHWQVLAHANGDAAIDLYLNALENANKVFGLQDRRSVIIHAQMMRDDQLDQAKQKGVIPSFFPAHTFYWGDWHKNETLGAQRANRISPTGSALNKGILFTIHHDAPVIPPSAIRVLDTAVNRTTRSGDTLGVDERISPYIALKAMTDWAAYQYYEEKEKGTIEVGKLADFVILDKNPLTIQSDKIKDINVLATYKEGENIYQAPQ